MRKTIIALFAAAALGSLAAGCTDDSARNDPITCPATCTEGCETDSSRCKRASFDEVHASYCQNVLACMQQVESDVTLVNYLDVNGHEQSFLITNMDNCLSKTDKMNHDMGDDETVTRCKNAYSNLMQCSGENMCNLNNSPISFCLPQKDAMYQCFEKRSSSPQIEDVWGYKAYCAASANCVQQNKTETSFTFKTGIVDASFAWWTAEGCETRFENQLLSPYQKELTACSREFGAYLSCVTTHKLASCTPGSGKEECNALGVAAYDCLARLK